MHSELHSHEQAVRCNAEQDNLKHSRPIVPDVALGRALREIRQRAAQAMWQLRGNDCLSNDYTLRREDRPWSVRSVGCAGNGAACESQRAKTLTCAAPYLVSRFQSSSARCKVAALTCSGLRPPQRSLGLSMRQDDFSYRLCIARDSD